MSPMFNILRVTCTNQNFVNMHKNEEDRTKDSFRWQIMYMDLYLKDIAHDDFTSPS